ncbi:Aste57867_15407 [Aphanomyces stellatus]|uniref:Aste57867_15407 protein n=1 Tax=Aphanomyces stellatus TaxID=120398 RepID=A0A485L419_9STRA|nr:hypothetical protein As57867_015351 [Aphanomyces stellatus]VFT92210.1 Aste57867_15407 [Aphanomyces stellatus]
MPPCSIKEPIDNERLEKTRLYYKNFMREYRKKQRNEVEFLQAQVEALEEDLRRRAVTADGRLPWRHVAHAMKEDMEIVAQENKALKEESERTYGMLHALYRWVVERASVPVSPDACISTWRNTSLPLNPTIRQQGKEWIMRQMFENTDRIFESCPLNDSVASIYDMDVQFLDECFVVRLYRQYTTGDESFAAYVSRYRENFVQSLKLDSFRRVDPAKTEVEASHSTVMHRLTTSTGEFVNLLSGEFVAIDRAVVVAQNIIDDEGAPHEVANQRNRFLWMDIRRRGDGTATVRQFYATSQAFTKHGGYISLETDAGNFHCDLSTCPSEWKQMMFRRRVLDVFTEANVDLPNI